MADGKLVGKVFKYFDKVGVAAVEVTEDAISVGDTLHFKGSNTDFQQKIDSMQIDRESVEKVVKGQSVGIKTSEAVRPNDLVYKV